MAATPDKYLDLLDTGHAYLLASDVQALEKYRFALDDALKRRRFRGTDVEHTDHDYDFHKQLLDNMD
jgi:hypothetical protein